MRRRINLSELEQPVTKKLEQLPAAARLFITDLLQGLSLFKITELSYARAAMLWAQVLRPENLKEPDFSLMLSKRFEQFHGAKAQLEDLQALAFDGSRWTGGDFKSGGRFTAKTFLLGDKRWIDLFGAGKTTLAHLPKSPIARRTSDLSGQLSSLLGTRILCGGELPLRLAIEEHDHELHGLVLSSPEATDTEIRRQLEPVLPFAEYKLTEVNLSVSDIAQPAGDATQPTGVAMQPAAAKDTQSIQLANLPLQIGTNLYCADETALFPGMGATGAALLAWTLVDNLGD
jgi:hypothetical protein